MGFSSPFIFHLPCIDLIVVPVSSDPFDPNDALLEIERGYQPITTALNVEDDPFRRDNTRFCARFPYVGRCLPMGFSNLVEPGIERDPHRLLLLMPGEGIGIFSQGPPGNNPHA